MQNQSFSKIWIIVILIILLAGGVLAWQYFGAPKEEVKVSEEVIREKTANWKSYKNEEYGFRIKYPPNWEYSEEDIAYLRWVVPAGTKSGVRIRFKPINKTYSSGRVPIQVEAYNFSYERPFQESEYEKEVVINNIKFIESKPVPGRPSHIFFADNPKRSGYVVITDFIPVIVEVKAGISSWEKSSYEAIFNQMLSTFRFLE